MSSASPARPTLPSSCARRRHLIRNSVRFVAEQDSLNASVLGPDAGPGTPEFDLFVKEVHREITTKAGQKCTAIRRILALEAHVPAVIEALSARLDKTAIGDPSLETTRMGALVSGAQRRDVLEKADILAGEAERVYGDPANFAVDGAGCGDGCLCAAHALPLRRPPTGARARARYRGVRALSRPSWGTETLAIAIELVNKGGGSLVASVITRDPEVAREVAMNAGPFHGRLYFNNRDSMKESTGHGSPMPHMVHGGPGPGAGGGEEMGGCARREALHAAHPQSRAAPTSLPGVGGIWVPGAAEIEGPAHPFARKFGDLVVGGDDPYRRAGSHARGYRAFCPFHRATPSTPTWIRAAAERNPFFPGPGRPWLPVAFLCRGPLCRTERRAGPGQHGA